MEKTVVRGNCGEKTILARPMRVELPMGVVSHWILLVGVAVIGWLIWTQRQSCHGRLRFGGVF